MWRERGGWGSEFHIEEATAFISIDATSPAHAQTLPFPFSPSVEHPAVHGVLVEAWPGLAVSSGALRVWRAESESGGAVHTPPIHRKTWPPRAEAAAPRSAGLFIFRSPCVAYPFVNSGAKRWK